MAKTSLWDLFISFARIGAFTFGGGYAMLPMLKKEVVEKHKWTTEEELLNYYAVGQCTPGVIAVNTGTFIGHKERGTIGGIVATAGVIAPSFLIILIIAAFLNGFQNNEYVIHALAGIKVAVAALVTNAVIGLWKKGVKDLLGIIIFAVVLALSLFFDISPIWIVIAAILLGLFYGKFAKKEKGGNK
ncbi:MAG: chromate transporter [Ruminococcaceae bacterium]|nr:chromate transporter [Oscillospiraceae bacterium]